MWFVQLHSITRLFKLFCAESRDQETIRWWWRVCEYSYKKIWFRTGCYSSTDLITSDLSFPHHLFLTVVYLEKPDDLAEKKKRKVKSKMWKLLYPPFFIFYSSHVLSACYLSGTVLGSGITRTKELGPRGLWSTWEPL